MALLPDGRLFSTMRTWTGEIWYSVSDDDGHAWRRPEILRYRAELDVTQAELDQTRDELRQARANSAVLVDQLATQIWEIKGNKLVVFKGKYREYILRRTTTTSGAAAPRILLKARPMVRDNSKETRHRQQALDLIEERIREKEMAMQRLSSQLQEAGKRSDFDQMHKISWQVAQTQAALEQLMGEWEKLAE